MTHGPTKERNHKKKINRKTRRLALLSTLSKKYTDGEMVFVEGFSFEKPRTAQAVTALRSLATSTDHPELTKKERNAALILLTSRNENTEKSFQNLGNVLVMQVKDVNPVNLLTYKYVLLADPEAGVKLLEQKIQAKPAS